MTGEMARRNFGLKVEKLWKKICQYDKLTLCGFDILYIIGRNGDYYRWTTKNLPGKR